MKLIDTCRSMHVHFIIQKSFFFRFFAFLEEKGNSKLAVGWPRNSCEVDEICTSPSC